MTDPLSKPMRTATYLVRLTPEEKANFEQKARVAAARSGKPMTLAHALREGARLYLDDLLEKLPAGRDEGQGDGDETRRAA
jgi:hypothetical protein